MSGTRADAEVRRLFAEHRIRLERYIRHFVGDEETQDVLQDVFIALLQQKRAEKIREHDEISWLYRACHNRAIDYLRKRKKLAHFSDEKFDRLAAKNGDARLHAWEELRGELYKIALGFGKKSDGALLLHLLEEGTPKHAIAEALGMSDRNLRRHIAQLFQYLQQELRKRGIEGLEIP